MKVPLLNRQLADSFNVERESAWQGKLDALRAAGFADVADGLQRFTQTIDDTYARLAPERLAMILELTGDATCTWNLADGSVDGDPLWKTMLGYAATEVEDRIGAWQRLVHPDDIQSVRKHIAAHIQGRTPKFEADHRIRDRRGEWRWMMLRGHVQSRDGRGEPNRLLVVHRDISLAKRWELALLAAKDAAEGANRARGAFLANMSHEIRTPMNAIFGMTELALDTDLDAEQRSYLNTIRSSSEALLTVINDVLDFSKIEAGKLKLDELEFPLHAAVGETVRALSLTAHQKGLEVVLDIERDVPARVFGDPSRLRQILNNLVGNAIKFTDSGEVVVSVAVHERRASSVFLRFCVRDSGIGIPPEKHGLIFDAFSQADVSTTRQYGGTGLGLAICNRLVQLMDGRIWLESEKGKGSNFYFTMRAGDAPAVADGIVLPSTLLGARALIAEDNDTLAAMLEWHLAEMGLHPQRAAHSAAAVQALEHARDSGQPFRIVLADAYMPAPAGFALAAGPTPLAPPDTLVMMLTTHSQRADLRRCRELGVTAHLVKPILVQDLVETLQLLAEPESATEMLAAFNVAEVAVAAAQTVPLNVLLVEDNPVNQMLAVKLIEKSGHSVLVANNGKEAVDQFEAHHFDIILMDVQMPVMGGIEATEAIRAREMRRSWVSGNHRPAHIVAMTAHAMEGDRERCIQSGMDDYLSKPIKSVDLVAVLDRARELRDAPQQEGDDLTRLWSG